MLKCIRIIGSIEIREGGRVMNLNPLISIVIPLYNSEKYIEETIRSVLNQTYKRYEVLIVNDKSSDQGTKLIDKLVGNDTRFTIIHLPVNKGVANARNVGIQKAKGEYIAFLDSDDVWDENKLEKQVKFLMENHSKMCCCAYRQIDEQSNVIKEKISNKKKVIDYRHLIIKNPIACFTVMIQTEIAKQIEMRNVKHEDFVYWLDVIKKIEHIEYIDEVLGSYRKRRGSISEDKKKSAKWRWNVYRNVEHLSFIKSCYYFVNYAITGVMKHYF